MADLVAADLTYTEQGREGGRLDHLGNSVRIFAITTAAGEYPTGGLPLSNGKLGCANELVALRILEQDVADPLLSYHHDVSANTIVIMEDDGTSGIPAEHANATITSPDQLIVEAVGW
jgi:hypothetical protein